MRVATVDGLVTLFYDGSKELFNRELNDEWWGRRRNSDRHLKEDDIESLDLSDECKEYFTERLSWQQIIVVDCVSQIPERTFWNCFNIERVIFADTVIRVEKFAFYRCENLVYIKWSLSLEYIGHNAFSNCNLSSVFIPPGCRQIGNFAFSGNKNLKIFNVPQNTQLYNYVLSSTKLYQSCPHTSSINTWIKNINSHDNFALHRVCCSFQPTLQMIVDTMKDNGGPQAFQVENGIGITPSKYLKENPYAHVKEKDIIEKYIRHMMGGNF